MPGIICCIPGGIMPIGMPIGGPPIGRYCGTGWPGLMWNGMGGMAPSPIAIYGGQRGRRAGCREHTSCEAARGCRCVVGVTGGRAGK